MPNVNVLACNKVTEVLGKMKVAKFTKINDGVVLKDNVSFNDAVQWITAYGRQLNVTDVFGNLHRFVPTPMLTPGDEGLYSIAHRVAGQPTLIY